MISVALFSLEAGGHELGDAAEEFVVEGVRGVGGLVVVRVAEFGGVGPHDGGDAFFPEGDVIAAAEDGEEWLDAAANARLVKNAEAYYRAMYEGAAESWNLRDTHMFETLCQLLDAKGPEAKAVVWAHNSHIGNAAFTEMAAKVDSS